MVLLSPPPEEIMFSLRVCLSVCLSVSTITEKVARGSASDLQDMSRMSPCRADSILVRGGALIVGGDTGGNIFVLIQIFPALPNSSQKKV